MLIPIALHALAASHLSRAWGANALVTVRWLTACVIIADRQPSGRAARDRSVANPGLPQVLAQAGSGCAQELAAQARAKAAA